MYGSRKQPKGKKLAKELDRLNALRKPAAKEALGINTGMSRTAIQNLPGRKPV